MYYFSDIGKQEELQIVLESWVGTPWRHRMAVKQKGCDCIKFVAAVFDELGLLSLKKVKFPDYAPDWHMHHTRQLLYDGIRSYLHVEEVSFDYPMNGDVMLFHFGKSAAHAAVYCDDLIYQSVMKAGVDKFDLYESQWWKRRVHNLRILV